MDTIYFYGRKEQDRHVRQIPSDSEDSDVDSEEEWSGMKDLSRSEKNLSSE